MGLKMFSQAHTGNVVKMVPALVLPPGQAGLHTIFDKQPTECFDSGAAVIWEGDPAGHVFEILDGTLRAFRLIGDGRRAIIGFLNAGDILGVTLSERYLYSVEAITPCKIRRIARLRFDEIAVNSPDLRPQLLARMREEMASAQNQMVLLGRKTAEERVSSFLLARAQSMAGQSGTRRFIVLPMSRLDIADYLGLTIETVSRVISKLVKMGVVCAQGRHTLLIKSADRLALLAGDEDDDEDGWSVGARTRQAVWPN